MSFCHFENTVFDVSLSSQNSHKTMQFFLVDFKRIPTLTLLKPLCFSSLTTILFSPEYYNRGATIRNIEVCLSPK